MKTDRRLLAFALIGLCAVFWDTSGPAHGQVIWSSASTVAEGYGIGLGEVIRAEGAYNLATSAAAINWTEAARRDLENREQWINSYFELRKANEFYRREAMGRRPTMEDAVRYAQMGRPQRLSPSEFDSASGKIAWPKLLQTSPFRGDRKQLEALFAKRAQYGGLSFADQMEIRAITDSLMADLQDRVREIPPSDYVQSRHFVESLAYEARFGETGSPNAVADRVNRELEKK